MIIILKYPEKFKSQVFKRYDNYLLASVQFFVLFCTFISPIYTFLLMEKIIVHTPTQDTNRKSPYINKIQSGNANSGGK